MSIRQNLPQIQALIDKILILTCFPFFLARLGFKSKGKGGITESRSKPRGKILCDRGF